MEFTFQLVEEHVACAACRVQYSICLWSFAWTCTTTLSSWVHELRSEKTLFNSQKEIEDQTTKLDALKDKQKQYIKIKRRKSILDGFSVISKDFA